MSLKIGDNVRFLNDIGGGVVTKIINNNIVNVLTTDGFEIPTPVKELVVIKDVKYKNESEEKQDELIESKEDIVSSYNYAEREDIFFSESNLIPENDDENNIYFGFVPVKNDNILKSDIDTFLINDSSFDILYVVSTKHEEQFANIDSGMIEANTKIHISNYRRENIGEITTFLFQFIFYKKGFYEPINPFSKIIKINPVRFYKESNFQNSLYFNNKAIILSIFKDDLKKEVDKLSVEEIKEIIKEKEAAKPKLSNLSQNYKKSKDIPIVEVDLHIQELLDDYKNLSNGEIVNIQINHFHSELEKAISNRTQKIIFIHGVGSGTLKSEILKSLDKSYPYLKYQDASFKEYGYGATLVFLKG